MRRTLTIRDTDSADLVRANGDILCGMANAARVRVTADTTSADGLTRTIRVRGRRGRVLPFLHGLTSWLDAHGFHPDQSFDFAPRR